jgi:hypothetical protein
VRTWKWKIIGPRTRGSANQQAAQSAATRRATMISTQRQRLRLREYSLAILEVQLASTKPDIRTPAVVSAIDPVIRALDLAALRAGFASAAAVTMKETPDLQPFSFKRTASQGSGLS